MSLFHYMPTTFLPDATNVRLAAGARGKIVGSPAHQALSSSMTLCTKVLGQVTNNIAIGGAMLFVWLNTNAKFKNYCLVDSHQPYCYS